MKQQYLENKMETFNPHSNSSPILHTMWKVYLFKKKNSSMQAIIILERFGNPLWLVTGLEDMCTTANLNIIVGMCTHAVLCVQELSWKHLSQSMRGKGQMNFFYIFLWRKLSPAVTTRAVSVVRQPPLLEASSKGFSVFGFCWIC